LKTLRKSSLPICGLAAWLALAIVPERSFADIAAYITLTETSPTTLVITTNLPGYINASPLVVPLGPGYDPPGTSYQFGADAVAADPSGDIRFGELVMGGINMDQLNGEFNPDGSVAFVNWLDPGSTPSDPLYDTVAIPGFGYTIAFASQNELPSFGITNGGCYNDSGIPVSCPVLPYGTVFQDYYNLGWTVDNVPFDAYGPLTVTFIDAAATPEPEYLGLIVLGLSGLFIGARRRRDSRGSR